MLLLCGGCKSWTRGSLLLTTSGFLRQPTVAPSPVTGQPPDFLHLLMMSAFFLYRQAGVCCAGATLTSLEWTARGRWAAGAAAHHVASGPSGSAAVPCMPSGDAAGHCLRLPCLPNTLNTVARVSGRCRAGASSALCSTVCCTLHGQRSSLFPAATATAVLVTSWPQAGHTGRAMKALKQRNPGLPRRMTNNAKLVA